MLGSLVILQELSEFTAWGIKEYYLYLMH